MAERPLDRNSPIPLYFQIAENLRRAIEEGTLKPGERLDNELDLTERLGVSRPTVRQAVQRLVEQGLVVRRRGLGTVVVAPRILRSVALTSLYDDLSATHRHPATTVLAAREVEADDDVAKALSLPSGSAVLYLERLVSAKKKKAFEPSERVLQCCKEIRRLANELLQAGPCSDQKAVNQEYLRRMLRRHPQLRADIQDV